MKTSIVVACAVLTACASSGSRPSDKDPISARTGDWAATLTSVNNSGVQGTARLQSAVVGSGVNISISGATPGAIHPWHVHSGSCANSGATVGPPDNYPLLTVGTSGGASATATIPALTEGNAYSVNVHRSPNDMGTVIACGDLKN